MKFSHLKLPAHLSAEVQAFSSIFIGLKAEYSSEFIAHPGGYHSCMHRFSPEGGMGLPVLLLHGSIENSRIFYSSSGKGFAPFLAMNGFDVFVPDLPGKGKSTPKAGRNFDHSQQQFIDGDLDEYIAHIKTIHPAEKLRLGGHSWGGVLALAWYAKRGSAQEIGPMVFFGTKRKLAARSLKRFVWVDLMWSAVGAIVTQLLGYLPAIRLKMGSDNEPASFYRETNTWVHADEWLDLKTGEDLALKLQNKTLPPLLFFAGLHDTVLGHPKDVKRLIAETGSKSAKFMLLSKNNGNAKEYNHIDILTARTCPEDHFPMAAEWLKSAH